MATWPTSPASTANLDAGTDRPSLARPDLKTNVDNVNAIIDMFNVGASPTNGNILKYSSSTTKFEMVADADVNTTYSISAITDGADANIRLTGSDSTIDDIQLIAGTNITLAVTSAGAIQINNSLSAGMTSFTAAGDTGTSQTIENGNTLTIAGGTNLNSVASGTDTVTLNLDSSISGLTSVGSTAFSGTNFDASSSAGGKLRNASGVDQLDWGAGGSSNLSLLVATNINPANASVSIAPTGTGSLTINPATAGTMNNVVIGGTTPATGTFSTLIAAGPTTLTTSLNGLLKATSGLVSAATAGTDYVAISGALGTPSSGNLTNTTVDGTNPVGFRDLPAVGTKTTSYTLAVGDVGKYVQVGSGGSITIPNSTFAEGDVVVIVNNHSAAITITCTISDAYIGGTDTDKATVSLATRGVCNILFLSGTRCIITGNVS
jgi:hypothetical protein